MCAVHAWRSCAGNCPWDSQLFLIDVPVLGRGPPHLLGKEHLSGCRVAAPVAAFGPHLASLDAVQEVEGATRRGGVVTADALDHAGGAALAMAESTWRDRRVVAAREAAARPRVHLRPDVRAEALEGPVIVTLCADCQP